MSKFTEVKPAGSEGGFKYMKAADLTELEGTYLGIVEGQFGPNYKFELESGETVVVNGCGALNKLLPNVETGSLVRLENKGKEAIQSGPNKGKAFHNIKVLVANS